MQSATIGAAFAILVIWMQRQGRWSDFFSALGGNVVLKGTRGAGQSPATTSSSGTPAGTSATPQSGGGGYTGTLTPGPGQTAGNLPTNTGVPQGPVQQ